jgi:hypothetical protein
MLKMTNQTVCGVKNMLEADHIRALRAGNAKKIVAAAKALEDHKKSCSICNLALQLWDKAKIGHDR